VTQGPGGSEAPERPLGCYQGDFPTQRNPPPCVSVCMSNCLPYTVPSHCTGTLYGYTVLSINRCNGGNCVRYNCSVKARVAVADAGFAGQACAPVGTPWGTPMGGWVYRHTVRVHCTDELSAPFCGSLQEGVARSLALTHYRGDTWSVPRLHHTVRVHCTVTLYGCTVRSWVQKKGSTPASSWHRRATAQELLLPSRSSAGK